MTTTILQNVPIVGGEGNEVGGGEKDLNNVHNNAMIYVPRWSLNQNDIKLQLAQNKNNRSGVRYVFN